MDPLYAYLLGSFIGFVAGLVLAFVLLTRNR